MQRNFFEYIYNINIINIIDFKVIKLLRKKDMQKLDDKFVLTSINVN